MITAAYRFLLRGGSASISVAAILAEAGLSTRAFYRHFASKDELLLAMFRADFETSLQQLRRRLAQTTSPVAALEAWVTHMIALAFDDKRRQRFNVMTCAEVQGAEGYAQERARVAQELGGILEQILTDGLHTGEFPTAEPGIDARALNAVTEMFLMERAWGATTLTAPEAERLTMSLARRALGYTGS